MTGARTLLLASCAFAACRILPDRSAAPQVHDFGPPRQASVAGLVERIPAGLVLDRVSGPLWTSTTAVQYRFLFDDPTRLRSYASIQWVAPPPALLEQRLRQALAPASRARDAPAARSTWDVRLETFEQQFFSANRAEVVIHLRAAVRPGVSSIAATTLISVHRPCHPTVQGAVNGLAAIADEAVLKLLQWLAEIGSAS